MRLGAIIVGAGRGERFDAKVPKCLVMVEGVPLIILAATPFQRVDEVESIVMVVPTGSEEQVETAVDKWRFSKVSAVAAGGKRRQDSVRSGLRSLPSHIDYTLVHDGARPLLSVRLLRRMINEIGDNEAIAVTTPVTDTLHRVSEHKLLEGPDRHGLVAAQTPQGFKREILEKAFQLADESDVTMTDEISLVRELLNIPAKNVTGETGNIKITHPDDIRFYSFALKARVKQMRGLGSEL